MYSVSFFYNGQSGSPYSFIYASSPNPFGNASNASLVYIPRADEQINFADLKDATGTIVYTAAQQQQDFNSFVNNDKYLSKKRGQYADRNGQRTPWNHEVDMKIMHEFKFKGDNKQRSLVVSLDVFNCNLINYQWGHINFVTNVKTTLLTCLLFANDAAGKKPGAPSTGYTQHSTILNRLQPALLYC